MGIACATGPAATGILRFLVGVYVLLFGSVSAYTLDVTTCDFEYSDTGDDIGFFFCQGGTYCTPTETDYVNVTEDDEFGTIGLTISVPVALGYEPTTLVVSNPAYNAWCLSNISWRGGGNLLGESGAIWFDNQFGVELGCSAGLQDLGSTFPCQESWRFFNLNGADGYTYDVNVTACDGTKSSTVQAAFCSTGLCSADYGEMMLTNLTMGDVDGGKTTHEVELPFNPVAMMLFEVDNDWCANEMTFNGFSILNGSTSVTNFDVSDGDGPRTMIISNIQSNGLAVASSPTKAFRSEPTSQASKKDHFWWYFIGAGLVELAVLVLIGVGLKMHCNEVNKSIRSSFGKLSQTITFWGAQAVLAGLFIALNMFSYQRKWGIVRIVAGFVLWCLVLAWFVAFQTDPVCNRIFCCCTRPPAADQRHPVVGGVVWFSTLFVGAVVWLATPCREILGRA